MDDAGFIIGSYVLTFGAMIAFAWCTVRLGRRLSRQVPDVEKYWR